MSEQNKIDKNELVNDNEGHRNIRVTIYEVARAANVSLATVSRVINCRGNVTSKTKERVERVIAEMGYRPSVVAKALATNRSTNIGVVIPSANYVYISNMLNGMIEVAKERGYNLTLFVTSNSHDDAMAMVEKVISSHVDGAIIFDDQLGEEDASKIASYDVPTIVINNLVKHYNVGCILFIYDAVLRNVINEKIKSQFQKPLVFLHVHNCGRILANAENIFIDTCRANNVEYHIMNVDDSYTKTYSAFMNYFKEHKSGYFVAYRDSIAASIINAATDSGLNVPEDVEVISLIGTKYANIVRPTISSMNIDMQEVGKKAVYMLNELGEGNLKNRVCEIDCSYLKRQSTKE